MKSKESIVAKQVRLNQWAEQIRECNSRPKGMSVDEWCENNHITKACYYWRMKKVRSACIEAVEQHTQTNFVELPASAPASSLSIIATEHTDRDIIPQAVIHTGQGLTIAINETASMEFMQKLMGALNYVK